MPTGTRPTSTLPPERQPSPANLEVFERAFATAEPRTLAPARGLLEVLAGFGGAAFAVLGGWLEPRCPSCGARGSLSLELRAVAEGEPSRLWERCGACETSWASVRCEDFSVNC